MRAHYPKGSSSIFLCKSSALFLLVVCIAETEIVVELF